MSKNGTDILSVEELDKLNEPLSGKVKCLIVFSQTGLYGERQVERSLIPLCATERTYKNSPFYVLGYDKDGLWAIEPDRVKSNTDETPSDCYGASQWEELRVIFRFTNKWGEKIKLGLFFLLAFALVGVLFLIGVTAMGGNPGGMM